MSSASPRKIDGLVRPLEASEVPIAHALIRSVGWPVSEPFVQALQASPCLHYYVLVAPDGEGSSLEGTDIPPGQIVGSIQLSRQGTTTGVGLVILDQRLRGKGRGAALFDWGVRRSRELDEKEGIQSSLQLTATPQGAKVYEKQGFITTGQTRELSLLLDGGPSRPDAIAPPRGHRLVPIHLTIPSDGSEESTLWTQAVQLCNQATSASRDAILHAVLRTLPPPPSPSDPLSSPILVPPFALGLLDDSTGHLSSWIGCFPMHETHFLGPLVSASLEQSKILLLSALEFVEAEGRKSRASGKQPPIKVSIEVDGRIGADEDDELGQWLLQECGMEQSTRLDIMEYPPRERTRASGTGRVRQWATLDPSSC